MMIDGGIYAIVHVTSGRMYVGSTVAGFKRRQYQHLYALRTNTHHCAYLQNAWNRYGKEAFTFNSLEEGFETDEAVKDREQEYIDHYWDLCTDEGKRYLFNVSRKAEYPSWRHDPEIAARASEKTKQWWVDNPERRVALGAKNIERYEADPAAWSARLVEAWKSPELRETASRQSQARWDDPEQHERMANAIRAGINSPEGRKNRSAARKREMEENPELRAQRIENIRNPEVVRRRIDAQAREYPSFTDPEDAVWPSGKNLRVFARTHGLNASNLRGMIQGTIHSEQGWKLTEGGTEDQRFCAYPSLVGPDGTIYPPGKNLSQFAREHGLNPHAMWSLVAGDRRTAVDGWTLLVSRDFSEADEARTAHQSTEEYAQWRKERLQEGLANKVYSEEALQKLRDRSQKPFPALVGPDGTFYPSGVNFSQFARDHGIRNPANFITMFAEPQRRREGWRMATAEEIAQMSS